MNQTKPKHAKTRTSLFNRLRELALLKQVDVEEKRLKMYVDYLSQYDLDSVESAIRMAIEEIPGFPDIAHLIRYIKDPINMVDTANLMVGDIFEAVKRYGRNQYSEAQRGLDCKAILAVEKFGGWNALCDVGVDNLGTAKAQLRDVCRAILSLSRVNPTRLSEPTHQRGMQRLGQLLGEDLRKLEE